MKANAAPLLSIFEKKMRLEVPLFQRQYVWNRDQQWEPLWEDISRKFSDYLEGRKDTPVHFLGAVVLDQKQTPTTHVEKRQIIDGQQRITTLQLFLSALRDFCSAQGLPDLAQECDSFISNRGMMADPETDQFKLWPTQADRDQFTKILSARSNEEVNKRFPQIKRKYARKPDPRPRMVEAYLFFYGCISEFFLGADGELPIEPESPLALRLEEALQSLKNAIQVVAIDLEPGDDPQVIFETLNARGEPLLPADLLRNYIFLRAARQAYAQEELYKEFWRQFDEPFWREEVRQGRISRPRSDLYIQHFLTSKQAREIPIKNLYVEYKYWIEKTHPYQDVRAELEALFRHGGFFRRLLEPGEKDSVGHLATFLRVFDMSTAYPLLLFLLEQGVGEADWKGISQALESYILRRAVKSLPTKNYTRIFLQAIRVVQNEGASAGTVQRFLSGLTGDSSYWPRDEEFMQTWSSAHVYHALQNARVIYILRQLDSAFSGPKSEPLEITGPLTVEHILPQNWLENWPLPDGSVGVTASELWDADPNDERAKATRERNSLVQTFGNLTLVTQALNSSVSNSGWETKKRELLRWSLLPINLELRTAETWDEVTIRTRGQELYRRALDIWPGPLQS